uniref:Anoctamin n=1 Tax=Phallusia mammillata TaxID=59560 RepID=A0A6F9D705_9ASCI|nr:anoctamin-7 [Phallusia mammillata]
MEKFKSHFKNFGASSSKEERIPILNVTDVEKGEEDNENEGTGANVSDDVFRSESTLNNFFEDGVTKIDFVLVYEETIKKKKSQDRRMTMAEMKERKRTKNREELHQRWRSKFIKHLRRQGLLIDEERTAVPEKVIHFLKINCPWHLLTYYAEELNIRAPLQLRQYQSHQWSGTLLSKLRLPNKMKLEVPNKPKLFFTCTFRKSKQANFLGIDNPDTYFSDTDRSRIVWEILQTTVFGKKKRAELGIERLLHEEIFDAAFPLHDGPYKIKKPIEEIDPTTLNKRQILYEYWARWGRWYKYQPLDHIKDYFGEKIGIYFAWLGFYTAWLLPVAVLGLIVFLGGLIGINSNKEAAEICNSGNAYMMCPMCDTCKEWALSKTCIMAKLSFLFDNTGTVIFAIIMSFWAVFFLEFWKRKSANLAHHWEAIGFEEEEEKPRPDYCARAPMLEANPITGIMEPHFPPKQRIRRMLTGFGILLIMLSVVIIFVVSVILYKCIVGVVMIHSHMKFLHGQSSTLTSLTGAVINLILIMLMSNVYTAVAEWLTKWEMHRTQTGYENALTLKVFIFQFVNYYSSIFYIAFFKGKLVGYPGHYDTMFGIRNETCGSGGCLIELAQQLFIIMVGKQAINNVQELVIPKFWQWWQTRKLKKIKGHVKSRTPWERDYNKLAEFSGLFDEYLEMVLQFGFITIFVAAFPLAPVFALLNNWIEIRLDASKLVCEVRRPVAHRAENIGIWYEILDALVQIAVITNAFLIAFTSEFIPRLLYKHVESKGNLDHYVNFTLAYAPHNAGLGNCRYKGYRDRQGHHTLYYYQLLACKLAFVIVFEHVVFFIGRMIDWGVPDVPESLQMKIKREQYLAKQALADNRDTNMEVMKLYHRSLSQDSYYNRENPTFADTFTPFNKLKNKWGQGGGGGLAPIDEVDYLSDNPPHEETDPEKLEQSMFSASTDDDPKLRSATAPLGSHDTDSASPSRGPESANQAKRFPKKLASPTPSPQYSDAGSADSDSGVVKSQNPMIRRVSPVPSRLLQSPDVSSDDADKSEGSPARKRHLAARRSRVRPKK